MADAPTRTRRALRSLGLVSDPREREDEDAGWLWVFLPVLFVLAFLWNLAIADVGLSFWPRVLAGAGFYLCVFVAGYRVKEHLGSRNARRGDAVQPPAPADPDEPADR